MSPLASYVIFVFVAPVIAPFAVTFASRAVCVAEDTGFAASDVLSTFQSPTSPLTIPVGVVITGEVRVLFVRVCAVVLSIVMAVSIEKTLPDSCRPFHAVTLDSNAETSDFLVTPSA